MEALERSRDDGQLGHSRISLSKWEVSLLEERCSAQAHWASCLDETPREEESFSAARGGRL